MSIRISLFDENLSGLKDKLESLKVDQLEFENLVGTYGPPGWVEPTSESNNPWKGTNRDGTLRDQISSDSELGLGVPLLFSSKEEVRDVLAPVLESDDPKIARLISADFTPSLMDLALRGQHWCSGTGRGFRFGNWRQARGLIGADALSAAGLTGKGVKIFVVDQGFNREYLESLGGTYGGGMDWTSDVESKKAGEGKVPHQSLRRRHGSVMVRTLVELAPDAEFFDLTLIPTRITSVEAFVQHAKWALLFLWLEFLSQPNSGPWIIVNSWGIVDRFGESLRGDYTNNANNWLNIIIRFIAQRHDVVFAAGNNGQFCPNPRASRYDVGSGNSIFGANGLPGVTSVGAVRTDGAWIGMSSQGPGPVDFAEDGTRPEKPDFCAPSWFVGNTDPVLRNSGTSTAAAVTAGAIAAMRDENGWNDTTAVSPNDLRLALRLGARPVDRKGWNERTGTGVLNIPGAFDELPNLTNNEEVS